jgi:hypothetical protein
MDDAVAARPAEEVAAVVAVAQIAEAVEAQAGEPVPL